MTAGGTQGLDLVCKLIVGAGDLVVAETPTYSTAIAIIGGYEGEILSISSQHVVKVLLDGRTADEYYAVSQIMPVPPEIKLPSYNVVKDANEVELPAVVEYVMDTDGRLFPHQWRHNLGWDKLPEDLREQHRTHENHPMTEEAFRIYNAGIVAEMAVKIVQEKHSD